MSGDHAQAETPSLTLGAPSPVRRFTAADLPGGELWIKDDGRLHPLYGGNKVRKLGRVLAAAERAGARRILTMGAAGSHHVLATTLFGRARGLRTAAVLGPQPYTPHAEQTLACALAWGLEPHPVRLSAAVPATALALRRRGDYLLPVGGWGVLGSLGFVDAAAELAAQLRAGSLPSPDVIVVAVGSGGMAAGLYAGLLREGLDTTLLGVSVFARWESVARAQVLPLARRLLAGGRRDGAPPSGAVRLALTTAELGRGYGWSTPDSDRATAIAARAGLELDATYTAKAFAAALRLLACGELDRRPAIGTDPVGVGAERARRPLRVLYWHSLSAIPAENLLREAPASPDLPPELRRLLVGR